MNYIEVAFTCLPNDEIVNSVLSVSLAEIGFDSFVETEVGTMAYILEDQYKKEAVDELLNNFPVEGATLSYEVNLIENQNWNEEWEKNYFQPLIIEDKCVVKSTFHKDVEDLEYTIVINPKMAFGTGHHQTTELMLRCILAEDFTDKNILDMGCGTAILAILASMRGAKKITAIDIDEWAYNNALECVELNDRTNIVVQHGEASLLGNEMYDVILANINRNILLNDIAAYAKCMEKGGDLFISGFYREDVAILSAEGKKNGLEVQAQWEKDNWTALKLRKI